MINLFFSQIIIIILGFIGLFISLKIYFKKQQNKKIVCPMRGDCNKVLSSTYSTIFGLPLEMFGTMYFAFVFLYNILFFTNPFFASPIFFYLHLFLSTGAVLLSVYLLAIQAFVLRSWCTWCIMSAIISISIFILFLNNFQIVMPVYLGMYVKFSTMLHLFGMAIGIGGATITDIFFFRFLKDYKINDDEEKTLAMLSEIIWVGLGILFVTGLMLFIPKSEELMNSGKFLTKMIVLIVITVNGFVLNFIISPKIKNIDFTKTLVDKNVIFRKIAFALGSISISSWYFAFFLGSMRDWKVPFIHIASIYIILLVVAIASSQFFEYKLRNRA